jgi:hypothetical protein
MPPRRGRVSAQNQAFLDEDRPGSGTLINYRRVPGYGPGNRMYYDPISGKVRTEDYVLNVYRPRLEDAARAQAATTSRGVARRLRAQRSSLADTYSLKKATEGQPVDQEEFNTLYYALKEEQLRVRFYPIEDVDARTDLLSPGSLYDQLLVALGRRLGNETFAVGESPKHAGEGGYINEVVIPNLNAQLAGQGTPIPGQGLIEGGEQIAQNEADAATRRAQRIAEAREMRDLLGE